MAGVLIVDGLAEFRYRLIALLERAGHRAIAVATISEARTLIEDDAPDLLATDAVLIDGSSETLAKQAEALGAKVLIMTGNADRILELDGAGRPYLSKPFTPEAFLERVRELLIPEAER
jgi:DNA-binding response OmpR family regulator